ncbi:MAG TPA: BamA/TamA family outer membrane protein [Vicinamibacterales bacterium]|nr:BamA/TamA family outer membrane protein [Vicinamibacterales bacterium]
MLRVSEKIAVVGLAAMVLMSPSVAAQTTRAEEDRKAREAKAATSSKPTRGKLESILFKVEDSLILERVLNPPRGIFLRLGGLGEGAGFGAGPGYRYQTGTFDARVSAARSLKGYSIGEASLLLPGLVKDGAYAELYGRRRDFPQEDFFGVGPDSQGQRLNFALEDTLGRVTGGIRRGGLTAGLGLGYLAPSVGPGTDKRVPSVETFFSPASLPGFQAQPDFAILEPFIEFSHADPPLNPTSGGRYRASFARYGDRDLDRFSFNRWDIDLRQYIPMVHKTRTIALRAVVSSARADQGHEVPFYLQPTLGGSYSLRGFRSFRFRDDSLAFAQAEYRWRINAFATGALFYETGAVARRLRDIKDLERDYGVGLRLGSRNGVAFRSDFAFGSGEGLRILLRFDNAF